MLSRTSLAYRQIQECLFELQKGVVIGIDPSIGSSSSQPGYSVYIDGILKESGTFAIDPSESVWWRLRRLAYHLRHLYSNWNPDVLVFEDIPAQRHGGNAASHASLLKAVGAILSVPGPGACVGILPVSWKPMARSTYEKSDEADAVEIAWIAIQEAKRIEQVEEAFHSRRKKKRQGRASPRSRPDVT